LRYQLKAISVNAHKNGPLRAFLPLNFSSAGTLVHSTAGAAVVSTDSSLVKDHAHVDFLTRSEAPLPRLEEVDIASGANIGYHELASLNSTRTALPKLSEAIG
jgi:hypothetical protein